MPAMLGGVMLVVMWLAACGSAPTPGSSSSAAAGPTFTPRIVIPKSVGGSPGKGPRVISNPAPLPGGKVGSQKVVLSDRTLVINSVTSQGLVKVGVTVRHRMAWWFRGAAPYWGGVPGAGVCDSA